MSTGQGRLRYNHKRLPGPIGRVPPAEAEPTIGNRRVWPKRRRPERIVHRHPPPEPGRVPRRRAAFLHPVAVPVPGPVLPVAAPVQAAADDPVQLGRTPGDNRKQP